MKKTDESFEMFSAHFPSTISQALADYATDVAFLGSRYLFTRRAGGIQFGYCTHCKKEGVTNGLLKHNDSWQCPKCKSLVIVKASGIGRKKMVDEVYFVFYEKSVVNPQAITARGVYAIRDYTKDYHNTVTVFKVLAMYLFEPGNSQMMSRNYWADKWQVAKQIHSLSYTAMKYKHFRYSIESIHEAAQGTPFQYCTWEHYDFEDQVRVFDFATKYPCMEYLTKLGMGPVISAKLGGMATYGAINWHGKTIDKVLRLTKSEAKEWVKQSFKSGLLSLYAYQKFKRLGLNLNFQQAHQICGLAEKERLNFIQSMSQYASIETIIKYIFKQIGRSTRYSSTLMLSDWKDYIAECRELGMDLNQESNLMPNNLHDAHQKTSTKVKFKKDKALSDKILKRAKELSKYHFEINGLIIRSAASNEELFGEGKALQHCVGGYAQRYADGALDIFVIRRSQEPEKPFYTMEVREGKVAQCRGLKNSEMTPEVKVFVNLFIQKKLLTKKRIRVDVTNLQPDNRQGVAI